MKTNKISPPTKHLKDIAAIKKFAEKYFYDVSEIYNPIIYQESELLKNKENEWSLDLKKRFHIKEDQSFCLRFDHTHPLFLKEYLLEHLNLQNTGPVFRNDFRSSTRWRQFYQQDFDYLYKDHNYRPLKKAKDLINDLKIPYVLYINDLSMLRNNLKEKSSSENYTEQDISKLTKKINSELYAEEVKKANPILMNFENLQIDKNMVRGWGYYVDLVFEFKYKGCSFASGGSYINPTNGKKYFGVSLGLNRILKILELESLELEKKQVVLIYNKTNSLPEDLLDELQKENMNYCLKSKKHGFKQDIKKITHALNLVNKIIKHTVIIGDKEIKTKMYNFKLKGKEKKEYTLKELVFELK